MFQFHGSWCWFMYEGVVARAGCSLRATWNWERERLSATLFSMPGTCFALKTILNRRHRRTSLRVRLSSLLSFDDCALRISTTLSLSTRKITFLFVSRWPHNSMPTTIGHNSKIAMLFVANQSGHSMWHHMLPKIAAAPWPEASDQNSNFLEESHTSSKNTERPL